MRYVSLPSYVLAALENVRTGTSLEQPPLTFLSQLSYKPIDLETGDTFLYSFIHSGWTVVGSHVHSFIHKFFLSITVFYIVDGLFRIEHPKL